MNCPACGNPLQSMQVSGVTVDVCMDNCGGIWFDNFELQKFDDPYETGADLLISVSKNRGVPVDPNQKRYCPRCKDIMMMRHFFSPQRGVEVDECPNCGGFWLDAGELATLRAEYQSELERKVAVEEFYRTASADRLREWKSGSQEQIERARRLEKMMRFSSPIKYNHRPA